MFSHSSSRNILREFQYSLMLLALLIDEITKVRAQTSVDTAGHGPLLAKVFLTGKEKKPEVSDKRVYLIFRKIIGFAILISDEI